LRKKAKGCFGGRMIEGGRMWPERGESRY